MGDIDHLKWLHEKQQSWIAAADSKTAFLGSVPLAMLAISASFGTDVLNKYSPQSFPLVLSTVLLFVTLYHTKCALVPRTSGPANSLVFFGGIAKLSLKEFTDQIETQSREAFAKDLLTQIHRNAEIASHKFSCITKATYWLAAASPVWLISLLLG